MMNNEYGVYVNVSVGIRRMIHNLSNLYPIKVASFYHASIAWLRGSLPDDRLRVTISVGFFVLGPGPREQNDPG